MNRSIAVLVLLAGLAACNAQQPPKPPAPPAAAPQPATPKQPYDSAKAQLAYEKEKNAQMQTRLLQQQINQIQSQISSQIAASEQAINTFVTETRKANGWDDTYTYDREQDKWTHTPKAPAPIGKPVPPQQPAK